MTPAMVSNQGAYDAGYAAGVAAERARVIELAEAWAVEMQRSPGVGSVQQALMKGGEAAYRSVADALRDGSRGGS